jgi:hypothetical protein
MQSSDDELTISAIREMARVKGRSFSLKLTIPDAMGLLGIIQLAARHPKSGRFAREAMDEIAGRLEKALALVGPAMAELCARGWNPDHDVARED